MTFKDKLLKKADLILIIIILIICGIFLLPKTSDNKDLTAVLYKDGQVVRKIDLNKVTEPYEFEFAGATVRVEKNQIRYLTADCPDKVCVNTGWLSHAGDTASCLPARTVITIEGGSGEDVMAY